MAEMILLGHFARFTISLMSTQIEVQCKLHVVYAWTV